MSNREVRRQRVRNLDLRRHCVRNLVVPRFGGPRYSAGVRVAVLSGLLALVGCSPFSSRKETVIAYSPSVDVEAPADWPKVDWQLVVSLPVANNMLSSTRIAVRPSGDELQVLAGARWSDTLPELLQGVIVRAFEDSGRILGVGRQASGLRGDYTLSLDVRAFEAVYQERGAPTATVVFNAKLLGSPGNRVLAARTFEAREQARGRKARAVVQAFETALEQSVADLVGWTLTEGQTANAESPTEEL